MLFSLSLRERGGVRALRAPTPVAFAQLPASFLLLP
jgi:hypothetical protein